MNQQPGDDEVQFGAMGAMGAMGAQRRCFTGMAHYRSGEVSGAAIFEEKPDMSACSSADCMQGGARTPVVGNTLPSSLGNIATPTARNGWPSASAPQVPFAYQAPSPMPMRHDGLPPGFPLPPGVFSFNGFNQSQPHLPPPIRTPTYGQPNTYGQHAATSPFVNQDGGSTPTSAMPARPNRT